MPRPVRCTRAFTRLHACVRACPCAVCVSVHASVTGRASFSSGILCAYIGKINGIRLRFR